MRDLDLPRCLLLNPASVHPQILRLAGLASASPLANPKRKGRAPHNGTVDTDDQILFEHYLCKLLRQPRQHFRDLSLQMRVSHHPMLTQEF